MDKIKNLILKYREQLSYLFFGGVTTVVNVGAFELLHVRGGMDSDLANAIAWVLAVAVAYVTNRIWVFKSHTRGMEAVRECAKFVAGRVLTGLIDLGFVHVGLKIIGPKYIAPVHEKLWARGVKLASNVLVVILNYVFSKLFIFKGKKAEKESELRE